MALPFRHHTSGAPARCVRHLTWSSLSAFLHHLVGLGFTPSPTYEGNSALVNDNRQFYGTPLPEFIDDCRTLDSPALQGNIRQMDAILAQILGDNTPPMSAEYRRQHVWGRSGNVLNIHRVNRGQLPVAWRKSVRRQQLGYQGVLTLCLDLGTSADLDAENIFWATCAALALAQHLALRGQACDVWGVNISCNLFVGDGPSDVTVTSVALLQAGRAWNIQNLTLTCERAFKRRLIFRAWEGHQAVLKRSLEYGYGSSYGYRVQDNLAAVASLLGVRLDTCYAGPHPATAEINDISSAVAWVAATLQAIGTHTAEETA